MLVFLRCVCMCVYVCVCACVYVDVWGVCGCACVCVCDMLICFLSALGSHEMGRHKLPIIIIIIIIIFSQNLQIIQSWLEKSVMMRMYYTTSRLKTL